MQLNTLGLSGLGVTGSTQWYEATSLRLNNVKPSLVHQYDKGRYFNSVNKTTGFPFTSIRTGNAMMFNSNGDLVWAPANMIPRSEISGGAVGIIGSGGSVPNGWVWNSSDVGVTREILEITPNYVVIRMYGTNTNAGAISYPHFGFNAANLIIPVVGQSYTVSANVQLIAGSFAGMVGAQSGRLTLQWRNSGGTYLSESTNSNAPTAIDTRLVSTGIAPATTAQCSPQINFAINPLGVVDVTLKVYAPQVEPNGVDSPKPYIPTTGTAKYCGRMDYNPETLEKRGLLVEATAPNFLARSSATAANWESASFATPTDSGTKWGFPVVKIATNSTAGSQFSYITGNTLTPTASSVYTISAFVKKDTHRYAQITPSANFTGNPPAGAWLNYDFDTHTWQQGGTDAIAGSGSAERMGDGWVRLQIAFTATSATGGAGMIFGFPNNLSDTRLTACTTLGASYLVFGLQAETGWLATSHTPTYGTSVTGTQDTTTLTSLPWFNQTKGTWLVTGITNKTGVNTRRYLDISDGTTNIRLQATRGVGNTAFVGNTVFAPTSSGLSDFSPFKMVIRHNGTNRKLVTNGGTVGTDSTAGSLPTSGFTQVNLGHIAGYTGGNASMAWFKELRYYADDTASDGQLQTLST